jgi:hypothetical protein
MVRSNSFTDFGSFLLGRNHIREVAARELVSRSLKLREFVRRTHSQSSSFARLLYHRLLVRAAGRGGSLEMVCSSTLMNGCQVRAGYVVGKQYTQPSSDLTTGQLARRAATAKGASRSSFGI